MFKKNKFNFRYQKDRMDCGPVCIQMISEFYGKKYDIHFLREICNYGKQGVTINSLKKAAEKVGFDTHIIKADINDLNNLDLFPYILHWGNDHYVVVLKINKKNAVIADPGYGILTVTTDVFKKNWYKNDKGVAVVLNPSTLINSNEPQRSSLFGYTSQYLKKYKKEIFKIFCTLLIINVLTFLLPFITQKIFDDGIAHADKKIIYYLILSQLFLYIGIYFSEIYRNWITVKLGGNISIEIIHNFFKKLIKLPIHFLETKVVGDYNQRIQDSEKIETFMTSQSITSLFSVVTIIVYLIVMSIYNAQLFLLYISITVISVLGSLYFLKKRRQYDYLIFKEKANIQNLTFEILNGITEVKLNGLEDVKLDQWKNYQKLALKLNLGLSKIGQQQYIFFSALNQIKNLSITLVSSLLVINNKLSLGELLTISFIVGQLNSPIDQLIAFFRNVQDSKLSMERISEIEEQKDEDDERASDLKNIQEKNSIIFRNVSFSYNNIDKVLDNINIEIPENKVTAIVGASGSGKTTLVKLILKFYERYQGDIYIKGVNIKNITSSSIRRNIGTVMQDGYLFSDTIERNITGENTIQNDEYARLKKTAYLLSNSEEFIEKLPLKDQTKVGAYGINLSGGQEQRLIIARAVFKNPDFLILDEATSALDTKNEKIIHNNLKIFFENKTVLIIAHRLSTVRNADNIIVMDSGKIIEQGEHKELLGKKNKYYELIKNQLELD
ncbi:peptidase domain-containing ABC transporter [Chryseobacterium pennipullorum]|uniref:Peptidase domain-containing ABC transporter n=1 Tax=Chryseobacterium pennipullorum TaxID=2258963 RepID=A0A3D9B1F4_9FLAO|nr:peptidase domain-containing ABC transporter [Chryseobacterium pennipullorum]REC47052.1 peptidase domain-containing ABC transporter [Chryseobacterium pennipullorum]